MIKEIQSSSKNISTLRLFERVIFLFSMLMKIFSFVLFFFAFFFFCFLFLLFLRFIALLYIFVPLLIILIYINCVKSRSRSKMRVPAERRRVRVSCCTEHRVCPLCHAKLARQRERESASFSS